MALNISCTNEQQVPVTANPVTAGGQPASLDPNAPFRVTVVAGDGTAELPGPGSLTIMFVSGTNASVDGETTEYLVEGDADPSTGELFISESVFLRVHVPQAASLGFTVGTAESK